MASDKQRKYDQSPFRIVGIRGHYVRIRTTKKNFVDTETGENYDLSKLGELKYVRRDANPFIKSFTMSYDKLRDLDVYAFKLLFFIQGILGRGETSVHFTNRQVLDWTGYKNMSTVYRAIDQLCEADFIRKSTGNGVYWINPNYFFNGERIGCSLDDGEDPLKDFGLNRLKKEDI